MKKIIRLASYFTNYNHHKAYNIYIDKPTNYFMRKIIIILLLLIQIYIAIYTFYIIVLPHF